MNDYAMLGEEVIAPAAALGEYPAMLPPEEGAAVWMQYLTAYGALIAIACLARRFCRYPGCVEQCYRRGEQGS
jgi:NADPH:quinone reductase-like Zn-dependent oxidoreductase